MNPIGISAIQEFHEEHKAIYVENNGWMVPSKYPSIINAINAIEQFVGIHDISSYGKIILNGDNILETLQLIFKFISSFTEQVRFMKSIDYDFTLLLGELTENEYFILVDRLHKTNLMEIIKTSSKKSVYSVDMTSGLTGIRLIGPMASEVIAAVSSFDIRTKHFSNMSVAQISLMEIHAYLFRIDIHNQPCYDIFVSRDVGLFVWNELIHTGKYFGITPFGVEVMNKLS